MLLNNHLYKDIIYFLLKYLYSNNGIYKSPCHLIFETTNYSLVSKLWFKYVSSTLMNEVLDLQNFKYFKSIQSNDSTNEEFKLIKKQGSIGEYYSFNEYKLDRQRIESDFKYKMVIVDIEYNEVLEFIKDNSVYKSNVYFYLSIDSHSSTYGINYSDVENLTQFDRNITIYIEDPEDIYDITTFVELLNKLKPKSINYYPNNSNDFTSHSIKLKEILNINSLECLTLRTSSASPLELIINNPGNLRNLDIPIRLHDFIKYLNGDNNLESYFKGEQQSKDKWNSIINSLSTNKSIRKFALNANYYQIDPFIFSEEEVESLDFTFITSSIKSLLSNQNNITIFELLYIDFIDQNIIDSIISNKTVRTLCLDHTFSSKEIIKKALPFNTTIRNLELDIEDNIKDTIEVLELLAQPNNIELYSVYIHNYQYFYREEEMDEILQFIKEHTFNIKEFNFDLIDQPKKIYKPQQIINNSIINLNINK